MLRFVVAASLAFSLGALTTADAASKKKVRRPAPAVSGVTTPYYARTRGPSWASPSECYTDEGYGRYHSCSAGSDY
jgi:hypothetical protein